MHSHYKLTIVHCHYVWRKCVWSEWEMRVHYFQFVMLSSSLSLSWVGSGGNDGGIYAFILYTIHERMNVLCARMLSTLSMACVVRWWAPSSSSLLPPPSFFVDSLSSSIGSAFKKRQCGPMKNKKKCRALDAIDRPIHEVDMVRFSFRVPYQAI